MVIHLDIVQISVSRHRNPLESLGVLEQKYKMHPPKSFVQFFLGFGPDATMLFAESHDPAEYLHACPSQAGKQQAVFSDILNWAVILGGNLIGSDTRTVDG